MNDSRDLPTDTNMALISLHQGHSQVCAHLVGPNFHTLQAEREGLLLRGFVHPHSLHSPAIRPAAGEDQLRDGSPAVAVQQVVVRPHVEHVHEVPWRQPLLCGMPAACGSRKLQ